MGTCRHYRRNTASRASGPRGQKKSDPIHLPVPRGGTGAAAAAADERESMEEITFLPRAESKERQWKKYLQQ
jgi:hypothetical protein